MHGFVLGEGVSIFSRIDATSIEFYAKLFESSSVVKKIRIEEEGVS
jgi:hypothetical protein